MYLWWFDDNPKKAPEMKIEEAIAAYVERSRVKPNVVLINEADRAEVKAEVKGVTVRTESYIRRYNFWVGWEDAIKQ